MHKKGGTEKASRVRKSVRGTDCINLLVLTHIRSIGLIQCYQAFFLWQKREKRLSTSFLETYCSYVLGYL